MEEFTRGIAGLILMNKIFIKGFIRKIQKTLKRACRASLNANELV